MEYPCGCYFWVFGLERGFLGGVAFDGFRPLDPVCGCEFRASFWGTQIVGSI